MKTTTIAAVTVGTLATALAAYAVYFDHRRRSDVEFRKSLKREQRQAARVLREEAAAESNRARDQIRKRIKQFKEEELSDMSIEQREKLFMEYVSEGEQLSQEGSDDLQSAFCFYKGLKIYPDPRSLIGVYENTCSKSVLELISQFIALDDNLQIGPEGRSADGMD
ncbi:MAG: hypothetical protein M1814_003271 [Vezdaea aestivalis]|nr:MAG: hypothetical protein M1814_003271 [Vezdaea aestivalis]